MTLGNFELDIRRFVAKANGNTDLVIRKVALDLFKRVIMKTPVDSGRAKGSWTVAIGSIPADTIELEDKGGTATIARAAATVLGLKAGDIIYCVSSLAYIRRLEFGYSKQAPAGMVRISAAEYPGVVRQAAASVPK